MSEQHVTKTEIETYVNKIKKIKHEINKINKNLSYAFSQRSGSLLHLLGEVILQVRNF